MGLVDKMTAMVRHQSYMTE